MICHTIDDVIHRLNLIVDECKQTQDKLGYFAVLYRKVTIRVKQGIARNEFEDNQRMEKLDVLFANRYFEAYDAYRSNQPCSACWQVAFDTSKQHGQIILQHLLLGINAHINLDLGIAALDTAGLLPLTSIQHDFNTINAILSDMVDGVKTNIGKVSPVFKWLMPIADSLDSMDEILVNFSIHTARDGAWMFANALDVSNRNETIIRQRDSNIAMLGRKIANPGIHLSRINRTIAMAEWRTVAANMSLLEEEN